MSKVWLRKYSIPLLGSLFLLVIYQSQMFAAGKKEEPKKIEPQKTNREKLRAFYTAPPVIPHKVSERKQNECFYCHREVRHIGERTSVKTPHPQFSNCLQCHAMAKKDEEVSVVTSWRGLDVPSKEKPAHLYAPPTIPHRIFLREKCLSCHGPDNPDVGLRTSHPQRTNCRQCHVADPRKEFLTSE